MGELTEDDEQVRRPWPNACVSTRALWADKKWREYKYPFTLPFLIPYEIFLQNILFFTLTKNKNYRENLKLNACLKNIIMQIKYQL